MSSARQVMCDHLYDLGLIQRKPNSKKLTAAKQEPVAFLAATGEIDETEALQALADSLSIPFIDVALPENEARIAWAAFQSEECPSLFKQKKVIPLWKEDGRQLIAMANPLDIELLQLLEFKFSANFKPVFAREEQIEVMLARYFPLGDSTIQSSSSDEVQEFELISAPEEEDEVDSTDESAPPVIRLCNRILADALEQRASDVHLEPSSDELQVRYRIDGKLEEILEIPKRLTPNVISRFKLLSGMNISEKRRPQDGRFRIRIRDARVDVRASSIPASDGEKIVLRLLTTDLRRFSFEALGFTDSIAGELKMLLSAKDKLLLVTGPTGSGKSTSLYSFVGVLNDGTRNIETVEDPIELQIPRVNQVQVNDAIGVTFASCLRSILRQDPDVIMIGEIRDAETAEIAVHAAETGHLVLSTLHTNDAVAALVRLRNLDLQPFQIASCLGGVLAQRLVRRLCSSCSRPATSDEQAALEGEYNLKEGTLSGARMPVGCPDCRGSGFFDRAGVYSFLRVSEKVERAILNSASSEEIEDIARANGFMTLSDSALELASKGITSVAELAPFLSELRFRDSQDTEPTRTMASEVAPASQETQPVSEPTLPEESTQEVEEAQPMEAAPAAPSGGIAKTRILLVEDDDDVRSILSVLLASEMFEVVEAANGKKALEEVYEQIPDVVLCDLMMPVMDGKEFLMRMRNHNATKNIPVIMLTAVDTEENEISLLELGASDFVSKASSSDVMLSRIRKVLRLRER